MIWRSPDSRTSRTMCASVCLVVCACVCAYVSVGVLLCRTVRARGNVTATAAHWWLSRRSGLATATGVTLGWRRFACRKACSGDLTNGANERKRKRKAQGRMATAKEAAAKEAAAKAGQISDEVRV